MKKNQGKTAKIDSSVCDQGNGGSYCSLCYVSLDGGNPVNNPDLGTDCPHCGAILESYGECYIPVLGSDF